MTCSCLLGSSRRARTRRTASSGTTPASGIGWRGSGGARLWSRRPSAWWTSASPCSPASLGVGSRDEVVWVDLERRWVFGPGIADGLEGSSPPQPLQVLGEVVGCDERQHVSLEALQIRVVEHFDRGVLDRAVHPLSLSVGPWVVGFGEPVLDAVLPADPVEDVGAQPSTGRPVPVFGQVSE